MIRINTRNCGYVNFVVVNNNGMYYLHIVFWLKPMFYLYFAKVDTCSLLLSSIGHCNSFYPG